MPIEKVVGQLLAQYTIADINVDNPPMESIIARIYGEGQKEGASGEAKAPSLTETR